MSIYRAILPLALVVGLALFLAADAEAGPISGLTHGPAIHAGGVHVGFGVGVAVPVQPVRHARHARHVAPRYRVRPAGRWVIQERQVWVPGEQIGYTAQGRPIFTEGFWTIERHRVWVPSPRRIHRRAVATPYATVRVGGRIR